MTPDLREILYIDMWNFCEIYEISRSMAFSTNRNAGICNNYFYGKNKDNNQDQ